MQSLKNTHNQNYLKEVNKNGSINIATAEEGMV